MSRKTYETQFLLGAKVQSSMGRAFGAVSKNLHNIQQQAKQSEIAAKGLSGGLNGIVGKAAGLVAAYVGFSTINDYIQTGIEKVKEQAVVETKLNTIMKQRMSATNQQIQSVLQLAAAQSKQGVISKSVQVAGAQELAIFSTKVQTVQTLIPAMNNLLVQQKGINGTSEDAVQIAKLLGKAMSGQSAALRRNGIILNQSQERILKYGNETQRAALLVDAIRHKVGNLNQEMAKTELGKEKQREMQLAAIQKRIAAGVIPIQAKLNETFLKLLPIIEKNILPLIDRIPPQIKKGADAIDWVAKNWGVIGPIVGVVTTAVLTYNATMAALKVVNTVAAAAQFVFNGALLACPITWIVAGITALVVAGYYLVKNWDKVKQFLIGVWNGFTQALSAAWQWLLKMLDNPFFKIIMGLVAPFVLVPLLIIKNWGAIMEFFSGMWKKLKPIFDAIGGFFASIFGGKSKTINVAVNAAKVPKHAAGTSHFAGGLTWAGEKGPELIEAPRGSRIFNNQRTNGILKGLITGGSQAIQIDYRPQITIEGNADRETISQAINESLSAFENRMTRVFERQKRLGFAG